MSNTLPEYLHYLKIDLFDNSTTETQQTKERPMMIKLSYAPKVPQGMKAPMIEMGCSLTQKWKDVTTKIKNISGEEFRESVKIALKAVNKHGYRFARANGCYLYKEFNGKKQKDASVPQAAVLIGQDPDSWQWICWLFLEGECFEFEMNKANNTKAPTLIATLQLKATHCKTSRLTVREMCEQAALFNTLKQKPEDPPGAYDDSIDEDDGDE
jgi:hypothetical protein